MVHGDWERYRRLMQILMQGPLMESGLQQVAAANSINHSHHHRNYEGCKEIHQVHIPQQQMQLWRVVPPWIPCEHEMTQQNKSVCHCNQHVCFTRIGLLWIRRTVCFSMTCWLMDTYGIVFWFFFRLLFPPAVPGQRGPRRLGEVDPPSIWYLDTLNRYKIVQITMICNDCWLIMPTLGPSCSAT